MIQEIETLADAPEPDYSRKLLALTDKVRDASRNGSVVPFSEAWDGTEDVLIQLLQERKEAGVEDIAMLRKGDKTYLYFKPLMTRSYAESAALVCSKDTCRIIAETVRNDSQTYPRPTPTALFRDAPFQFSVETLLRTIEELLRHPEYPDIRLLSASDGSQFLFSSRYMPPAHAEALAEWTAVGNRDYP